jgi:hypothetical protein
VGWVRILYILGISCRFEHPIESVGTRVQPSYLRNTLAVLSPVENRPCDLAGVLSLQEEGLGFAVLESEDLAVTADVEFTLRDNTC